MTQNGIINSRADLKDWLAHEKKRGNARGGIYYLLQIRENEILYRHMRLLRYAEYHKNTGHTLRYKIAFLRLLRFQNHHAIHVPLNVCGRGFKIMHLGPILINGNVRIGQDCTMHINTSLVAGGTNDGTPVLGDHIVVGVGAVILGAIYISDYVAVGANAVVNKDILEKGITVAGVPAKKISDHGTTMWGAHGKATMTEQL